MPTGLAGRVARVAAITAILSVLITSVVTVGLVRRYAEADANRDLERRAAALAGEAVEIQGGKGRSIRRLLEASGDLYAILPPDGRVATDSPVMVEVADMVGLEAAAERSGVVSTSFGRFAFVMIPQNGRTPAVLLARPVALTRGLWSAVAIRVGVAAVLAVVLAFVAATFLSRRLTRPIKAVAEGTNRITKGDLYHRVPEEGRDEVGDLARSFNQMAGSLSEARRRERELLASISHELKTPLTVIKGYAEALRDGTVKGKQAAQAVELIDAEATRLERLVGDVLDLARAGAGTLSLHNEEVDLRDVLLNAQSAHRAAAGSVSVALEVNASTTPVITDSVRVRQVVDNLVENALRVTPSGGAIRLDAKASNGYAWFEVSDTGPGIPEEDLPHLFERSYLWNRFRGERPVGTGLGLAIVREIVSALGGRIEARSENGLGTTFRVTLAGQTLGGPQDPD